MSDQLLIGDPPQDNSFSQVITWRSNKQNVVARLSLKAQGVSELLWMKVILEDLKIAYGVPTRILRGNKSAIYISHNPVLYDRTKGIEIDWDFIKKKLDNGVIAAMCVPSRSQTNRYIS